MEESEPRRGDGPEHPNAPGERVVGVRVYALRHAACVQNRNGRGIHARLHRPHRRPRAREGAPDAVHQDAVLAVGPRPRARAGGRVGGHRAGLGLHGANDANDREAVVHPARGAHVPARHPEPALQLRHVAPDHLRRAVPQHCPLRHAAQVLRLPAVRDAEVPAVDLPPRRLPHGAPGRVPHVAPAQALVLRLHAQARRLGLHAAHGDLRGGDDSVLCRHPHVR
mmetsp:Transcript_36567/g.112682  ORF Transcript_36567/g.112682 Transcript_36567/m.112682 type:complete len:224 (+) Transcript_36567:721-1392(+)